MDSRKTFKLFQESQSETSNLKKQLNEERGKNSAQIKVIRSEYEGTLSKNAAYMFVIDSHYLLVKFDLPHIHFSQNSKKYGRSSSTDQIEMLIKKCDTLNKNVERLKTENDVLRTSVKQLKANNVTLYNKIQSNESKSSGSSGM